MAYNQLNLINHDTDRVFLDHIRSVADRKLSQISNVTLGGGYEILFKQTDKTKKFGYIIECNSETASVSASDKLGLLSGFGRLLQEGSFGKDGFEPAECSIEFIPGCDFYGTYFATHFGNYYMTAPLDEIKEKIEDLALWGSNLQRIWFDFHHYSGTDDPKAKPVIERLRAILEYGRELGMLISFGGIANEGFSGTPEELKAEWWKQNGYHNAPLGHYHVEICPSKPGGMELILENRRAMLDKFGDLAPDIFSVGTYDQGGCTCKDCAPYGANGYIKILPELTKLYKAYLKTAKACISGWYIELFIENEWKLYWDKIESEPELAAQFDYITGINSISMPKNERKRALLLSGKGPGKTRTVGFSEISMHGATPWGGFGANPYPAKLQEDWDVVGNTQAGMWSYSEGIFEDVNKIIVLGLYSGRHKTAFEAMRAYIRFEFSDEYCDEIFEILGMMEKTLPRTLLTPEPGHEYQIIINDPSKVAEIKERVIAVDMKLPEKIRKSWRWRLVYLRAVIDGELSCNGFHISEQYETYMRELEKIYHVRDGETCFWVSPASKEAIRKEYGRE